MVEQGNQAMIKAVDTSGKTAADYATEYGLNNIVTLIIDASKGTLSSIPLTRNVTPLYSLLESPTNSEQIKTIMEDTTYMKSLSRSEFFKILIRCIQKYPENKDVYGKIIGDILDKVQKFETNLRNVGELWKANTSIISDFPDANKSYTLFMYVAMTPGADTKLMDIFLSRIPYAYITAKDIDGNTMLHHLAKTPGPEKLELLNYLKTKNKYAPVIVNNNNEQPIFLAVQSGNTDMALELFKDFPKNQINYQNSAGNTLLIEAAKVRMTPLLTLIKKREGEGEDKERPNYMIANKEGETTKEIIKFNPNILTSSASRTYMLSTATAYKMLNLNELQLLKQMFFDIMNITFCPVCLGIETPEYGCVYFSKHSCLEQRRHEELFQKYKDPQINKVVICKLCNGLAIDVRTQENGVEILRHRHIAYKDINEPYNKETDLYPIPAQFYSHGSEVSDDVCIKAGGKGFVQKFRRMYAFQQELCKYKLRLENGEKLDSKKVQKSIIETVWRSSQDESLIPNLDKVIKDVIEELGKLRKQHDEKVTQVRSNTSLTEQQKEKAIQGLITVRDQQIIDSSPIVDKIFNDNGAPFLCNTISQSPLTDDEKQKISGVLQLQSSSTQYNIAQSNIAQSNIAQSNVQEALEQNKKSEQFLKDREIFITELTRRVEDLDKNGQLGIYERDEGEQDVQGKELIEVPNKEETKNFCAIEGGPHSDNRPTYMFTHVQPDTDPLEYFNHTPAGADREYSAICAAHLRQSIESMTSKDIPKSKLLRHGDYVLGVSCPIDNEGCNGHIFPDKINEIPSEQFFLPLEDEEPIEEGLQKQKGDEFKRKYNINFIKNHIIYDYDKVQSMRESMSGGQSSEDILTNIAQLLHKVNMEPDGMEECELPPKQQAGIRIKTYRRKVGLRNVTRRV
jgi:hypothetical protein